MIPNPLYLWDWISNLESLCLSILQRAHFPVFLVLFALRVRFLFDKNVSKN